MKTVILFAFALSEACRQEAARLDLPNLERLLARLSPSSMVSGDENSLSMPHEREIARARGIEAPDGCIPLAALAACGSTGSSTGSEAFAWITPCHWHVAMDHITMSQSSQLQLTPQDAHAVFQAVSPYFEQDGIAVEMHSPQRWLARGEVFRDLPTASLDRVDGGNIDRWIPRIKAASALRRLQQETQMLLYTHEVNDRRQSAGLLPINSFWISGTGALPASAQGNSPVAMDVKDTLREPALAQDWAAWSAAWRELDATLLASLGSALDKGEPISLTLCGERSSRTWTMPSGRSFLRKLGARMTGALAGKRVPAALEAL
ncbi:MAG: hypothetical protein V4669_20680 [Pseudomonadota bacterium]